MNFCCRWKFGFAGGTFAAGLFTWAENGPAKSPARTMGERMVGVKL